VNEDMDWEIRTDTRDGRTDDHLGFDYSLTVGRSYEIEEAIENFD